MKQSLWKRWQSPCEASARLRESNKFALYLEGVIPSFLIKKQEYVLLLMIMSWHYLIINTKAWKGCITSIKQDQKKKKKCGRRWKRADAYNVRIGTHKENHSNPGRSGERRRVSAFKYLNHAPVTPFPHVEISVYQNESWQKTSALVCVQTACVDSLMESAVLMHFLQSFKIPFKAI